MNPKSGSPTRVGPSASWRRESNVFEMVEDWNFRSRESQKRSQPLTSIDRSWCNDGEVVICRGYARFLDVPFQDVVDEAGLSRRVVTYQQTKGKAVHKYNTVLE